MPRMIPPVPRDGANVSERKIFSALESMQGVDDWVVIHSLRVARHRFAFAGEADFIVLAPGKGIVIIEAKSPSSVRYENGDWYLENTPSPDKDPLQQIDGVRRSLRGYLKELDLLEGSEPIMRLVWFTSIGRHDFENASAGDMQLFEWELGWKNDLSKPAWLLNHLFDEYDKWYSQVDGVSHDPEAFTAERVNEITHALLGNFHVSEAVADRLHERQLAEATLLAEQELVLELLDRNNHLYLDGPAGTGKSHLIIKAARNNHRAGLRTLVTCWNLLMADEIESQVGSLSNIDALDINTLMLKTAQLTENPEGSGQEWYTEQLPQLALTALKTSTTEPGYDAILVDEFQDIAGFPHILEFLSALAPSSGTNAQRTSSLFHNTKLLLAGDSRQQIMRRADEKVDAFAVAKEWVPGLVHVRLARNCRNAQSVIVGAQKLMPRDPFGFTGFRMPPGVPSGFQVRDASENETGVLVDTLRELLQEFSADQIVILSPFAENRSLIGRFLARSEKSRGERWLRKQLETDGVSGRVRWRSVFKFKGLDADAVIVTDVGETARAFTAEHGLSFTDLLYVALTRAKYRCVVLST